MVEMFILNFNWFVIMDEKSNINAIITDLDDTIWDWMHMWHSSFEPYLNRISSELNVDKNRLIASFKKLHQSYKTSEASFIYNELDILNPEQKELFERRGEGGKSILHEYYSLKKNNLKLYDGVLDTLRTIKSKGTIIIGFTESNAFFTKYRLKHLNIDGLFDFIYAPVDFDVPESVYKHYSEDVWEPALTEFRYLAKNTKKPAPEILELIIKNHKIKKNLCIYIGDKLVKDVSMANEANVRSVHAEYGHNIKTFKYDLLKQVTHWTEEEVRKEIETKTRNGENPIAGNTIKHNFNELNQWFHFQPFPIKQIERPKVGDIIIIWQKIIDVQQHFNDIALRIRNIALTVFTFIIGGIGYAEKEGLYFLINSNFVPFSTVISFFGIVIMLAFYYMDKYWYHRLLIGAVNQGVLIEDKWANLIPEIRLTNSISKSSPHKILRIKIHSKFKFVIFYGLLISSLVLVTIITLFIL